MRPCVLNDRRQPFAWLPEFIEARKAFKAALLEKSEASQEEQRRIAEILRRAAQEIRA